MRLAPGAAALLALCSLGWPPDTGTLLARTPPAPSSSPVLERPAPAHDEVRALWVLRSSLTTPQQIDRLVRRAREGGFNTLLLQVRSRGDAVFAGSGEPRGAMAAGFDPLAHAIGAARAAGLRVHAWVNVNLISSAVTLPADRSHLVHARPEWLMVPRELAPTLLRLSPRDPRYVRELARWTRARNTSVEGLYASPIPAAAARYLERLVETLAARYDIDGLHLDYIRFPGPGYDYSAAALAAFRETRVGSMTARDRARLDARVRTHPTAYADTFPAHWAEYRRRRLADLVARLRAAVRTSRPEAWITAAVVPDPAEAARDRLQDWPDWARRGLLDAICPMTYTADLSRYSRQVAAVTAAASGRPVWAGVGAYRLSAGRSAEHVRAARAAGAAGVVLFSYDSLISRENPLQAFREIERLAFRGPLGAGPAADKPAARTEASVP